MVPKTCIMSSIMFSGSGKSRENIATIPAAVMGPANSKAFESLFNKLCLLEAESFSAIAKDAVERRHP